MLSLYTQLEQIDLDSLLCSMFEKCYKPTKLVNEFGIESDSVFKKAVGHLKNTKLMETSINLWPKFKNSDRNKSKFAKEHKLELQMGQTSVVSVLSTFEVFDRKGKLDTLFNHLNSLILIEKQKKAKKEAKNLNPFVGEATIQETKSANPIDNNEFESLIKTLIDKGKELNLDIDIVISAKK